jgi:predicted  nucleic acid-binding Zn-ribbon protein
MSPDTLRWVLQVLAVTVGGGTVQLIIFMLRRRAELRNLNTSSDATVNTSYRELVDTLRIEAKRYEEQVKGLQERVAMIETRYETSQRQFTAQLNDAHIENNRLATRVAHLTTDLDIANRQVDDLRYRSRGI